MPIRKISTQGQTHSDELIGSFFEPDSNNIYREGKTKVGEIFGVPIVVGDVNLLKSNEVYAISQIVFRNHGDILLKGGGANKIIKELSKYKYAYPKAQEPELEDSIIPH